MRPEIRRTVRIQRSFTGAEITDALKNVARQVGGTYIQQLSSDHDGVQIWHVGIAGKESYGDVSLRTNQQLNYLAVRMDETYSAIGIGSADWHYHQHTSISEYDPQRLILEVEAVRDCLEARLGQVTEG